MTVSEFIGRCVTPFQAADLLTKTFADAGYLPDPERFERGGKYVLRAGNATFAVAVGAGDGIQIAACHVDTPCFRLKQRPDKPVGDATVWLTEPYGGALRHTWTSRRIGIAGAVAVAADGGAKLVPVVLPDRFIIPDVAIHFDRNANENCRLNAAVDFNVLGTGPLSALVADALGIRACDIFSTDLRLFAADEPFVSGRYFVAPRIDDLTSAFAISEALRETPETDGIAIAAFYDLEEVGSAGKGGAGSPVLSDLIARIAADLGLVRPPVFFLSVDNAHGAHPLHPELTRDTDEVTLGCGIVLKHNANRRYGTDLASAALVKTVARRANVPVADFSQRSDLPCGSTLGAIAFGQVDALVADIGIAQLAMHAACEVCDAGDIVSMQAFLRAFFSAEHA